MKRRAGYSLLEVLVAFAVMSAVLAVLVPGQAELLGRVSLSSNEALADEYALSLLEELSVAPEFEEPRQFRDWNITAGIRSTENVRAEELWVLIETAEGKTLADARRLRPAPRANN